MWLKTNHLRNFLSDGLSQDKSCKTFLENDYNIQFHLYSLKVSVMSKLLCFEIFGMVECPKCSPLVACLSSRVNQYQPIGNRDRPATSYNHFAPPQTTSYNDFPPPKIAAGCNPNHGFCSQFGSIVKRHT